MKTSSDGILAILNEEAVVLGTYRDAGGVATIGVGHTGLAGAPTPGLHMRLELEQALAIFLADLGHFEARVAAAVARPLAQHEFDALVDFDFNTGSIASGSVDDRLDAGQVEAAMATLQRYTKAGGVVMSGLRQRRAREACLFITAQYPVVTHIKVYERFPGSCRLVPVTAINWQKLGVAAQAPQPQPTFWTRLLARFSLVPQRRTAFSA